MGHHSDQRKLTLGILISGNGSNLQAIVDACSDQNFPAHVGVVVSNNPDAYGLSRADEAGISRHIVNHKDFPDRESFDSTLDYIFEKYDVDLICLAGFTRILGPEIVQKWDCKMINTHPSLLPKFGGEGMHGMHVHQAVIDAKESESGASVHYVIADVDQGEIILQKTVDVHADDTPETLHKRVLEQEHIAYPEAIAKIAAQSLADDAESA